jgi:alginate O-acetyltransferase complex protein AlgJ
MWWRRTRRCKELEPAERRPAQLHPRLERLLIAVFLVVLVLPAIGTMFGIQRATAAEENRTLAPRPRVDMSRASWRAFPAAFTRYFEDNFAFRPLLVRWQAMVRLNALGVSPSPSVVKGTNGWWFYADDGAMLDYAEARPFTRPELEVWRQTLQNANDWLRARGIEYVFVLAPDKHQVYPEYMPQAIRRAAHSRMDQLVAYLAAHSTVRVLDLRPALWHAKSAERIYHQTDTHWNDRGAYVAYAQIMSSLSASFPALHPRPKAMFEARHVRAGGFDLARMMGLFQVLEEDNLTLESRRPPAARIVEPRTPNPYGIDARLVTTLPDGSQPRAVIFRDSFASALIPFLSEHFSRAVYLWQYNVDPSVIEREQPDIVIHQMVGRRLATLTPYDPFAQVEGEAQAASGRPEDLPLHQLK